MFVYESSSSKTAIKILWTFLLIKMFCSVDFHRFAAILGNVNSYAVQAQISQRIIAVFKFHDNSNLYTLFLKLFVWITPTKYLRTYCLFYITCLQFGVQKDSFAFKRAVDLGINITGK